MFKYECRKLFLSKFFLIATLILFVLFGANTMWMTGSSVFDIAEESIWYSKLTEGSVLTDDAAEYYDRLGNYEAADLQKVPGNYADTAYGDWILLYHISQQVDYVQETYASDMAQIVTEAYSNLQNASTFYYKTYNEICINTYNRVRNLDVISEDNAGNFLYAFEFYLLGMLLCLYAILLVCYSVGLEESGQLMQMIRASKYGRRRLRLVKLAACALAVTAVMAVISVTEIVLGVVLFQMDIQVLGAAIQSISAYELCPLAISILGYLLLRNAFMLVLLFVVMALTWMLAGIIRSIPTSVVVLAVSVWQIYDLPHRDTDGLIAQNTMNTLRTCNPFAITIFDEYFTSFDYANLFGVPVFRLWVCLGVCILVFLISMLVGMLTCERVNLPTSPRHGNNTEIRSDCADGCYQTSNGHSKNDRRMPNREDVSYLPGRKMMGVSVKQVTKKYKSKVALSDFSTEFETGINILLGPNGAGKSTLMNSIADIIKITSGSITYDGQDIFAMSRDFREILGFLPQNPEFYPFFTGMQVMKYFAKLKGVDCTEEELVTLMNEVHLSEAIRRKVGGYSGGMRRRLGIAVALIGDPKVLIFDEPTAGLDPKERLLFKRKLTELAKDKIIIMATHIISDVEDIGDKVIMIKDGKNIGEGDVESLINEVRQNRGTGDKKLDLDDVYMYWFDEESTVS